MRKRSASWSVFVLTVLFATGCPGEDGDTIIVSGLSWYHVDRTPFAGLSNNNLAPDGGGLSSSEGDATSWRVAFNTDQATSDGAFSGDGSAVVLFTLRTDDQRRLYASYWSESRCTPPVRLEAPRRDPSAAWDLDSFVCMPLNTSAYRPSETSPAAARVRANAGNWLILGPYRDQGGAKALANWTFRKASAQDSHSAIEGAGVPPTPIRYGFQVLAHPLRASEDQDTQAAGVREFALVSEGLCGQTAWRPGKTDYQAGEDTQALALVFAESDSSLDSAPRALRYQSFDLARLTWSPPKTLDARGAHTGPEFTSYNTTLFFRSEDTSQPGQTRLSAARFSDQGAGVCSLTSLAPLATHPAPPTRLLPFAAGDEGTRSIYGSDEGLRELTLFGLSQSPAERELVVLTLPASGPLSNTSSACVSKGAEAAPLPPVQRARFRINRSGDSLTIAYTRSGPGASPERLYATLFAPAREGDSTQASPHDLSSRLPSSPQALSPPDHPAPVNAFRFQGKTGYRAGWQSKRHALTLFWEQSGSTSDELYASRLLARHPTSAKASPALVATPPCALTFTDPVLGTPKHWLEGNVRLHDPGHWRSVDAGGGASGAPGSVLVAFTRVDDASGEAGDVSVYASLYDGEGFEIPLRVGTGAHTRESLAGIATSDAIRLQGLASLPNNADLNERPDYPSREDSVYTVLFLRDRSWRGAASDSRALLSAYSRTIRAPQASEGVASLLERISPPPSLGGPNPRDPHAGQPKELIGDSWTVDDAGSLESYAQGPVLSVVFERNHQLWFQSTVDGEDWLTDASTDLPDPGLICNFSSANVQSWTLSQGRGADQDLEAGLILFTKRDREGRLRAYLAAGR